MRETMIKVAHRLRLAATGMFVLCAVPTVEAASPYSILGQYYRQRESDNTWMWIVVGLAGLGAAGIAFYMKRGQVSLGRKKGRVVVGDQQIDTYRLLNLMMTGQ